MLVQVPSPRDPIGLARLNLRFEIDHSALTVVQRGGMISNSVAHRNKMRSTFPLAARHLFHIRNLAPMFIQRPNFRSIWFVTSILMWDRVFRTHTHVSLMRHQPFDLIQFGKIR
jgi:hypothetical protein